MLEADQTFNISKEVSLHTVKPSELPGKTISKINLRFENESRVAVYFTQFSMVWISFNEPDNQNFTILGKKIKCLILSAVASP